MIPDCPVLAIYVSGMSAILAERSLHHRAVHAGAPFGPSRPSNRRPYRIAERDPVSASQTLLWKSLHRREQLSFNRQPFHRLSELFGLLAEVRDEVNPISLYSGHLDQDVRVWHLRVGVCCSAPSWHRENQAEACEERSRRYSRFSFLCERPRACYAGVH